MKTIFALCASILIFAAIWLEHSRSEPVRFGTFVSATPADVPSLLTRPEQFAGKTVSVQGRIAQQCRSMGCFFFFQFGRQALRIDLQEIAMHAPMREGKTARVEGQLVPYDGGYQLYATAVEFR